MRTERYFTLRLRAIWRPRLSASRLCYTIHTECQYQGIVKVPGSFRPSALNEHLYSYCNFAELLVETVGKSLRHSCRSELTRQGISPVSYTHLDVYKRQRLYQLCQICHGQIHRRTMGHPDSTGHACSQTRPLRHRTPQYRKHSGNR